MTFDEHFVPKTEQLQTRLNRRDGVEPNGEAVKKTNHDKE